MTRKLAAAALLTLTMSATDNYREEVEHWRAERQKKLAAEDGWLTVVGLDWLKEGENRVGSNPAFEVKLPKSAPDRVGTITVKNGKARFKPEKTSGVTFK